MFDSNQELSINKIYEEIINTKIEIKNAIEASEARILMKIESLKSRVNKLEKENIAIKNKVELLERSGKKNNFIIFGLKKPAEVNINFICLEVNRLLNINLTESDFSDVFCLGNSENAPIKVELVSFQKKKLVFQNCRRLKGSKISISHDLTKSQREENQALRRHLVNTRQNTSDKCYIKGNKLSINNIFYTLEELENLEYSQANCIKQHPNSAPPTPNDSNVDPDEVFANLKTQAQNLEENPKPPTSVTLKAIQESSGPSTPKNSSNISSIKNKASSKQGQNTNVLIKDKLRHRSNK